MGSACTTGHHGRVHGRAAGWPRGRARIRARIRAAGRAADRVAGRSRVRARGRAYAPWHQCPVRGNRENRKATATTSIYSEKPQIRTRGLARDRAYALAFRPVQLRARAGGGREPARNLARGRPLPPQRSAPGPAPPRTPAITLRDPRRRRRVRTLPPVCRAIRQPMPPAPSTPERAILHAAGRRSSPRRGQRWLRLSRETSSRWTVRGRHVAGRRWGPQESANIRVDA